MITRILPDGKFPPRNQQVALARIIGFYRQIARRVSRDPYLVFKNLQAHEWKNVDELLAKENRAAEDEAKCLVLFTVSVAREFQKATRFPPFPEVLEYLSADKKRQGKKVTGAAYRAVSFALERMGTASREEVSGQAA